MHYEQTYLTAFVWWWIPAVCKPVLRAPLWLQVFVPVQQETHLSPTCLICCSWFSSCEACHTGPSGQVCTGYNGIASGLCTRVFAVLTRCCSEQKHGAECWSSTAMARLLINAQLCFLRTQCGRVLSQRCSKHTHISSQVKKLRADSETPLSTEQLERIARNKSAAVERLSSRAGTLRVGESWRKALAPQFNKQYFTSVIRRSSFSPHFTHTFFCDRVFVLFIFSSSVDELCGRWETKAHSVSSSRAGLHLDTDVSDWRCRFLLITLVCNTTHIMKMLWSLCLGVYKCISQA